ncbi:MAG: 30S ribosomal protein S9, partial [Chitinophagaceae bacterium]
QNQVVLPLKVLELTEAFDIIINVQGGGIKGQAEAIKLGISRALLKINPEYRPSLKSEGFLTRDPRGVERKKFGQKKARKRFQFSKR